MPLLLANVSVATTNIDVLPPGTCDDIRHCRKLSHIIWSCASTIFIYTYVSMHLNVPSPRKHLWKRAARVVRMMAFALFAPELFVGFAYRQYCTASRFMEGFREDPMEDPMEDPSPQLQATRTEGFFFAMGGFADEDGHPITRLQDFRDYDYPQGEEIDERRWVFRLVDFVVALLRPSQRGPVYLDATLPLSNRERMVGDIEDKSNKNLLAKAFAVLQGFWFILQCAFRLKESLPLTQLEVMTVAYGGVNLFIWLLWWYKPIGVDRPIILFRRFDKDKDGIETTQTVSQHMEAKGRPRNRPPLHRRAMSTIMGFYPMPGADHVPEFWSSDAVASDIRSGLIVECAVGCLFGWIHVAAWNSDFRTAVELWLWRGAAVAVTCVPLLIAVVLRLPGRAFQPLFFWAVVAPLLFIYCMARLLLVALAISALRKLPYALLEDVSWSSWFPHIT